MGQQRPKPGSSHSKYNQDNKEKGKLNFPEVD